MDQDLDLRSAILICLKNRIGLDMLSDLTVYPHDDGFAVSYMPSEASGKAGGLSAEQAEMLCEEGEMLEFYDNPEEAVDMYLKIRSNY